MSIPYINIKYVRCPHCGKVLPRVFKSMAAGKRFEVNASKVMCSCGTTFIGKYNYNR